MILTTKNPLSTSTISQPTMAYVLCFLALLCFVSCVAENTETEQEFKDLQIQPGSLSWLDKLRGVQQVKLSLLYLSLCSLFMFVVVPPPRIPATIECTTRGFPIYKVCCCLCTDILLILICWKCNFILSESFWMLSELPAQISAI